jgi:competence protein ComEC
VLWPLAWLAGLALQLAQAELQTVSRFGWTCGVVALCWIVWLGLGRSPARHSLAHAILGGLCVMGLSWVSTEWRATQRLQATLPADLEGVNLWLEGRVTGLPQRQADGWRLLMQARRVTTEAPGTEARFAKQEAPVWRHDGALISLFWRNGRGGQGELTADAGEAAESADGVRGGLEPPVRAGEVWQLPVRLKRPHGLSNPGGFDAEFWLFDQGVMATGSVSARGQPVRLSPGGPWSIDPWRQRARDALFRQVAHARAAGLLAALSVGDQSAIAGDDWALFRNAGVAHLVSISGLHVTMFAWMASLILGACWRRSPAAMLWCPAPVAALWGGVALATAYALFCGWGIPAQRTVWMLALTAWLRSSARQWPWPRILLWVATLICALDPWALRQAGFWLSFGAVALLMVGDQGHRPPSSAAGVWARCRGLAREGLRTQLIATLGLAPLTLVCFQQLSLAGLLANLVSIPLVTLFLTPLALIGMLWAPVWTAGAGLAQAWLATLTWMEAVGPGAWQVPAAPEWAQVCGLLGAAVCMSPLPWRLRACAVVLVLPLLMPSKLRPAQGQFELLALDVGQGTAVWVRTRSHGLLFDTGPAFGDSDSADRAILPALRWRGERQVDALVLSHRDSDHVGGAPTVLRSLPVRRMLSSLEPDHPLHAAAAQRGVASQKCLAGEGWEWDGVRFEFLHPDSETLTWASASNAKSCVLKVSAASGRSALLTGDAEQMAERQMLGRDAASLRSEVLLVPHHGSKTSSSAAFLAAVNPGVAFVQAGYRSRYGHPAPPILKRYADLGIPVLRSDECGAWLWRSAGNSSPLNSPGQAPQGTCWRTAEPHYWHWRSEGG